MKLTEVIEYLIEPEKHLILYRKHNVKVSDDDLTMYMQDKVSLESLVHLFPQSETGGRIEYLKDGKKYVYLLEVDIALDLIEASRVKNSSNDRLAKRILEYAQYDA